MNELNWTPVGPPPPRPPPLPPPPPPHYPPSSPVSFSGDRGEFFRLVARGAGLELVTVGFYRFWLTTDIRRHLWSNTHIDGDAAEYTGRARELLIGFLIALAIIVPVYLAYFIASLEAERVRAFASFPLLAFFYLFGQFAIFRARRYRLTRTVWRGVRFWMDGSGWAYAGRAALWGLLLFLTLGLILPWRDAALERYKMRHSWYGNLQGSFEGTGWEFFKRGWWIWLLALATLLMLFLAVPLAIQYRALSPLVEYVPGAGFLIPIAAPFLYGAFKAIQWRWWMSGIRFGDVRLKSSLRRGALIGLYWKMIGWVILLVLALIAWLALCAALMGSMSGAPLGQSLNPQVLSQSIPLLVLAAVGYLLSILAVNVVMRVYLTRDLWVRVLASTVVYDIEAAANVSAQGELADALGEGIADGLDVGGF